MEEEVQQLSIVYWKAFWKIISLWRNVIMEQNMLVYISIYLNLGSDCVIFQLWIILPAWTFKQAL